MYASSLFVQSRTTALKGDASYGYFSRGTLAKYRLLDLQVTYMPTNKLSPPLLLNYTVHSFLFMAGKPMNIDRLTLLLIFNKTKQLKKIQTLKLDVKQKIQLSSEMHHPLPIRAAGAKLSPCLGDLAHARNRPCSTPRILVDSNLPAN